jgi:DNA repair exonuclease SbcCD nuclease subunit
VCPPRGGSRRGSGAIGMGVVLRFLHTADWQLGLKLAFVPGDRGALARGERFEAVRRLAAVAKERRVDAVVVAGDVFDDNAVGRDTLQRARDAVAEFAPVPVLLLPGNHDAASADSVLRRFDGGAHVHALLCRTPFDAVPGARFYPCPLFRRHEREDPTQELPERAPGDPIRVAIAHGGLLDFSEGEAPNLIDWRRVLAKGFDYLALGDWHGTLSFDPRVFYSGTPEATRFKEKRPGLAVLVEIDEAGALPRVEEIPVSRTRWIEHSETLEDDAHVDALARWFDALPARSMTLVELTLRGFISMDARARLERLLDEQAAALLLLRWKMDALHDKPTEEDLVRLGGAGGFLGGAVLRLRELGTPAAEDALRLLHGLLLADDGQSDGTGASERVQRHKETRPTPGTT